ncbi:hypothetical protein Tco_0093692 [Tanacetum coccineum]
MLLPLGDHTTYWCNLLDEIVKEFPMHYSSWHKIEPEKKARVMGTLRQRDWDKQIDYWLDAKNAARALQNAQNQAKSKVFCRKGSWSLVVIRDMQMKSSKTREDLGANTPMGVPYTEDQIMAMVCQGKQRGYILGVGRVLARQDRFVISNNKPRFTHTDADVDEVKEENKKLRKEINMLMTVVRSNDLMLLTQLQSEHEVGGDSDSGVVEDDAGRG